MSLFSRFARTALVLAVAAASQAQPSAAPATISFSLDFPQSIPDHYVVSVSSDGHATYDSTGKLTPQSDPGDLFRDEFTVTPDTCKKIFELAGKAKYFEGQIDSGNKKLASTGVKVLKYSEGSRKSEATYNYSPIQAVQQLTTIFQNISTTLEFGRRLDYYHHHQKLALEEELKHMEEAAKSNNLAEVQAVAPILKSIVDDHSIMNITRARAQRLLASANAAPVAGF
jgi:hypothetical protein